MYRKRIDGTLRSWSRSCVSLRTMKFPWRSLRSLKTLLSTTSMKLLAPQMSSSRSTPSTTPSVWRMLRITWPKTAIDVTAKRRLRRMQIVLQAKTRKSRRLHLPPRVVKSHLRKIPASELAVSTQRQKVLDREQCLHRQCGHSAAAEKRVRNPLPPRCRSLGRQWSASGRICQWRSRRSSRPPLHQPRVLQRLGLRNLDQCLRCRRQCSQHRSGLHLQVRHQS
mmetsp:Transcript_111028/g.208136  ORF Transcript_111028/g.208136 Transcript_111028/m.208136 type:complete len:223 (-) Transcript_111028:1402-2070(-)